MTTTPENKEAENTFQCTEQEQLPEPKPKYEPDDEWEEEWP